MQASGSRQTALLAVSAATAAALSLAAPAHGQQRGVTSSATGVQTDTAAQQAEQYWTPERLLSAKPMDLRAAPKAGPTIAPLTTSGPSVKAHGALPENAARENKVLIPQAMHQLAPTSTGVTPFAEDAFSDGPFTTSRVFDDSTVSTYPYLTAGKLYFSDPRTGGNFVCSASVLRPRLVATAGHCVTHPSTASGSRYFYNNFLFIPAFNNGVAPVGSWTSSQQWVSNVWYYSDGSVPNAGDWGMLIMTDKSGVKIWQRTGYLGYRTLAVSRNNLTMLGYPCNLDSCNKMEYTNAGTAASGGNNTWTYGSAMRGGASGGPWIQDFGIAPVSNPAVPLASNYLTAVTSYGPVATDHYYLGASQFDSNWISLLNAACGASTSGNC